MSRLYFGKIAPTKPQQDQTEGEDGWSWRYKVRIFNKHTPDKNLLPDEKLPWAQVLMPVTAGSGAANYAQTPSLNQGDTVSIQYLDDDEQMPVITGILPRTNQVSTAEPQENTTNAYQGESGFTENKNRLETITDDESNENNKTSQPSPAAAAVSSAAGTPTTLTDTCDLTAYRSNAVTNEINNLLEEIARFGTNGARLESLITSTIDRVHALVNPYVGEMFNNLFEALVPILNAGLSALYKAVFAKVLAATQSPIAAKIAAEAALLALRPAILALQEAISILANKIVTEMLGKVEDLIRDTVDNNDSFSSCAGTQFNAALVNSIISDVDAGMAPLISAVAKILSGGFDTANNLRSNVDLLRSFAGALTAPGQSGNKCGGMVKEYVFGVGPKSDVGDVLDAIVASANQAQAIADSAIDLATGLVNTADGVLELADTADSLIRQFGDFPFMSDSAGAQSFLDNCSTKPPETCYGPEVIIFGGRGEGATATAYVANYVDSVDERTITDRQGGVVSIEVTDGGSGYVYPPYVEIRDNCELGLGAVARSIIKNGEVVGIYMVTPGANYVAVDDIQFLVVDSVPVINGGFNYAPGVYSDQFGGTYQVTVNDEGTVTQILPTNYVQIPQEPIINIPRVVPEIPPGGGIQDGNVVNAQGQSIGVAKKGRGLIYKPILLPPPTAQQISDGDLSDNLTPRLLQTEVINVVDCPD